MARANTSQEPQELPQYVVPTPNDFVTEDAVRDIVSQQMNNMVGTQRVQSGDIRSSNFVAGSAGWQLTATGVLECADATIRGTLVTGTTGFQIRISSTTGKIELIDGSTIKGAIYLDGSNSIIIETADNVYFTQTGVGQLATFQNGNLKLPSGGLIGIGGYDGVTSTSFDIITHVDIGAGKEYYHTFDFRGGVITNISTEHNRNAS
jgi:hypothetical protein